MSVERIKNLFCQEPRKRTHKKSSFVGAEDLN
jgi:hypothetical protein